METSVPPLSIPTSMQLLQQLGLSSVPHHHLREVSARVGGIPLCLEWIAALVQDPFLLDDWQGIDLDEQHASQDPALSQAEVVTRRLLRLLAEPTLMRGHMATRLQPLLERLVARLSAEARRVLNLLALCNVPLGKPALQALCERPRYLKELRDASLLVASSHRVQLLPMVASAVIVRLTAEEVKELEGQVLDALRAWVKEGTMSVQEAGQVVTELAMLLLQHRRLQEAAELLIQFGWLTINQGYIPQIVGLIEDVLQQPDWHCSEYDECGGLLLRTFLRRYLKLQASDAERTFQRIDELIRTRRIELSSNIILYLLYNNLRILILQDQCMRALTYFEREFSRYEYLQKTDPIAFIDLLNMRAYVLGRWGDSQAAQGENEEAHRNRQACVDVHMQCLLYMNQYEPSVSPLPRNYMLFKRARYLNDIAFYQRSLGHLEEAKQAMRECLDIKERELTLPGSLAVSYGDYGQLLGELGHFQKALSYSNRALQIIQKMIDTGLSSFQKEKGMQLIDRGKLLHRLGRLNEARACFEEGIPLVEGTSRRYSAMAAKKGLEFVGQHYKNNAHYYLDWQWFPRYQKLASYSDVGWLAQAGPFSEEEQQEWNTLIFQKDDELAAKRLATIIALSRKRELALSLREEREPCFHYPRIPCEEVQSRITGFSQIRTEIERDESNAIVRRLYLSAIDELLDELHMIAAVSRQDADKWISSRKLENFLRTK